MTLQEKIEVMQHCAKGGEIECKLKDYHIWNPAELLTWNWARYDYRIKPLEKEKEKLWYWEVHGVNTWLLQESRMTETHIREVVVKLGWKDYRKLEALGCIEQ